jgi:hypothetical protein
MMGLWQVGALVISLEIACRIWLTVLRRPSRRSSSGVAPRVFDRARDAIGCDQSLPLSRLPEASFLQARYNGFTGSSA